MMKRVHMTATRKTRVGLLREGKNVLVADDVADELIAAGHAIDLDKPEPETATRVADEDASTRTKRVRK